MPTCFGKNPMPEHCCTFWSKDVCNINFCHHAINPFPPRPAKIAPFVILLVKGQTLDGKGLTNV